MPSLGTCSHVHVCRSYVEPRHTWSHAVQIPAVCSYVQATLPCLSGWATLGQHSPSLLRFSSCTVGVSKKVVRAQVPEEVTGEQLVAGSSWWQGPAWPCWAGQGRASCQWFLSHRPQMGLIMPSGGAGCQQRNHRKEQTAGLRCRGKGLALAQRLLALSDQVFPEHSPCHGPNLASPELQSAYSVSSCGCGQVACWLLCMGLVLAGDAGPTPCLTLQPSAFLGLVPW